MTKLTDFGQTIVALATALGTGSIAVVRLSGTDARHIVNQNFIGTDITRAKPNTIHHGSIVDDRIVIDDVLVSVFQEPNSYTGENVVEISCHANPIIVDQIISRMIRSGAAYAKPGEFTLRAFINGKMDLAQAEAISSLISAKSASGLSQAINQLQGGLSDKISRLRHKVIDIVSLMEIDLDFSEENIEIASPEKMSEDLQDLISETSHLIESYNYAKLFDGSLKIALIGPPNAGKSTLLNSFLGEERAITSELPGTTRDTLHENILIDNTWIKLVDTAGLRNARNLLELEGINRAHAQVSESDLVLYVVDLTATLSAREKQYIKNTLNGIKQNIIVVGNKIDIKKNEQTLTFLTNLGFPVLEISARNKTGLTQLKKQIMDIIAGGFETFKDETVITSLRHRDILNRVKENLCRARKLVMHNAGFECVTIDLRAVLDHLGEITGETVTDNILDHIFSGFCIGK